jgi:multiple antibiotic resistance protein
MDEALLQFGLTAFVTLLVVVDPVGVAPLFVALTGGLGRREKRATLTRAVGIAFGVAMFFLLAGRLVLSYLGVTVNAFAISGGVLLFATALPMLFGHRGGLQAPEQSEEPSAGEDVAVFPLAIPLLSGPGTIATILLLTTQSGGDLRRTGVVALAAALVYLTSWVLLLISQKLMAWLGQGKMHIVTRVLGIILAALAVQYVLNGVTGYYRSLSHQ